MSKLNKIKAPVKDEMDKFEIYFKKSVKSKVSLLDVITNYIVKRKGKQIRPLLVFLTAKMLGKINKSTFTAAALIELLHTATLIHDDVVDESYVRRGFFSVKALWKSKVAVLVGDFLLSKGLLLATENKELILLEIVSEAVKEMAEGELLQIEKSRRLNITEEVYFDIINKKTATLIASCTASGAKSVGADSETIEKIKNLGRCIGIIFQIKDDLFDYQINNLTGKPPGNDIQEKKLTLPLIYALNISTTSERKKILKLVKKNKNKKNVSKIIKFVKTKGGIEYAQKKMNEFYEKAVSILNYFPKNDANNSLKELLNYIIIRKN